MSPPSEETYHLAALLILSIGLGHAIWAIVESSLSPNIQHHSTRIMAAEDRAWMIFPNLVLNMIAIPLFIFILFFALKALPIIISGGPISDYRNEVLGSAEQSSTIFESTISYVLYSSVFSPLLFSIVLLGSIVFWQSGRLRLLVFAICALALDQLVNLGRFGFYYIAIINVWIFLYISRSRILFSPVVIWIQSRSSVIAIVIGAIVGSVLVGTSLARLEEGSDLSSTYQQSIEYHTLGFTLFDIDLADKGSMLNLETTYGRASLGGVDEYLSLLIKRIYPHTTPIRHIIGTYQNRFINVGARADGTPLFYNAYYTSLFTLYLDGGWVGILIGGIIFGAYVCRQNVGFYATRHPTYLMRLAILLYLGLFSIFLCPLMGPKFWIALLITYIWNWAATKAHSRTKHRVKT